MKGDYSKILEIAKYDPGVMRSREAFIEMIGKST